MKLKFLLLLSLPFAMFGQDRTTQTEYPNTYSSGSADVQPFTNQSRLFRDWSISVGGGGAFMTFSDLTSFYGDDINWGWNAYASLDKQISHAFGLSLQYQTGQTNQKGILPGVYGDLAGVADAWTKFHQVSIIGDINFSNLLRRVDNHSPYRWAFHGYAGIGVQSYKTLLIDQNVSRWSDNPKRIPIEMDKKMDIGSIFYQGGLGLKYNLSKLMDIELRTMYIKSGDDEFDGGGDTSRPDLPPTIAYNLINDSKSDDMFVVNLGFTFKLGKHLTHLAWYDPLQDVYARTNALENNNDDLVVCEKGDGDNDGVCDDWDRQLDTPAGARVDGAGVALDMDLDGIIDLYDQCVTVPGPVENNGCPTVAQNNNPSPNIIETINKDFEGIEFELNSDKIRTQSFEKLNHAADVIKSADQNLQFLVVGATDTRGSDSYNLTLSQKRANAVVKYLNDKGVKAGMLTAEGRGEKDLKYPECDPATKCPEWKNEANRRVYFLQK